MADKRKEVLFLRFSSLGDIIFANYTAMRVKEKHPDFRLTWLVDSLYAGIVRAQPWVDAVIEWDRKNTGNRGYLELLRKVRRMGFDILVDMHGSDRSSLFSLLSGIKERYCPIHRFPFTHTNFDFSDLMDTSCEMSEYRSYLCAPRGVSDGWRVPDDGRKKLGLAIGASAPVKRWPIRRWIEFCRLASEAGYGTYLMGSGEDEARAAREICEGAKSPLVTDMVGRTSIEGSIALVSEMDAVISGDTGLMHIARALGKPVAGLFGPNFPGAGTMYMESLGSCFFCGCPEKGCEKLECSRLCLEDIGASEVFAAAKRLTQR